MHRDVDGFSDPESADEGNRDKGKAIKFNAMKKNLPCAHRELV